MPIASTPPEQNTGPLPFVENEAANDDIQRASRIANDTEEMRQVLRELFSWICVLVSIMWIGIILLFMLFAMSGEVNYKHIAMLLLAGSGGALSFAGTYYTHLQENSQGECKNYAIVKHEAILKAAPAAIVGSLFFAAAAWMLLPVGRSPLNNGFDMGVFKWLFAASTASVLSVFGAVMYWLFRDRAK